MKIYKRKICTYYAIITLVFSSDSYGANGEYELKLIDPVFIVPQFTGEFRKREASISPSEYELAEQIKVKIRDGKIQEALQMLEGYLGIELSPALLLLRAQIYFQLEMWDDAEFNYQLLLDRMPQLVRAHSDLGQFYLVRDSLDQAREHFAKAVALGSNDAVVHGQLGYLNLKQHNAFSAISSYQIAMTLEPDNVQWQQGLLTALTQARMYESALALSEEMIKDDPDKVAFWLLQASLYTRIGNLPEALTSLEIALRMQGFNEIQNIEIASQLHFQLGSYDRGIELMSKVMQKSKLSMQTVEKALSWLMIKEYLDQAETLIDSVEKYENQLSTGSKSTLYRYKAKLAADRHDDRLARLFFEKSIDTDATNGLALIDYAEYLRGQKDYERAELYYMRVQSMDDYKLLALRGRARINVDRSNYEQALGLLQELYRQAPEESDLVDNIQVLQNIVRNNRH